MTKAQRKAAKAAALKAEGKEPLVLKKPTNATGVFAFESENLGNYPVTKTSPAQYLQLGTCFAERTSYSALNALYETGSQAQKRRSCKAIVRLLDHCAYPFLMLRSYLENRYPFYDIATDTVSTDFPAYSEILRSWKLHLWDNVHIRALHGESLRRRGNHNWTWRWDQQDQTLCCSLGQCHPRWSIAVAANHFWARQPRWKTSAHWQWALAVHESAASSRSEFGDLGPSCSGQWWCQFWWLSWPHYRSSLWSGSCSCWTRMDRCKVWTLQSHVCSGVCACWIVTHSSIEACWHSSSVGRTASHVRLFPQVTNPLDIGFVQRCVQSVDIWRCNARRTRQNLCSELRTHEEAFRVIGRFSVLIEMRLQFQSVQMQEDERQMVANMPDQLPQETKSLAAKIPMNARLDIALCPGMLVGAHTQLSRYRNVAFNDTTGIVTNERLFRTRTKLPRLASSPRDMDLSPKQRSREFARRKWSYAKWVMKIHEHIWNDIHTHFFLSRRFVNLLDWMMCSFICLRDRCMAAVSLAMPTKLWDSVGWKFRRKLL